MQAALLQCAWLFSTLYGGIADVTDRKAQEGECMPKHSRSLLQAKFEAISPKSYSKLYGKSHDAQPGEAEKDELVEEGRSAAETAQVPLEEDPDEMNDDPGGKFAKYFPSKNVIMCACEKCGSTSLYMFMYQTLLGEEWNFTGPPFIQRGSHRWQGQLRTISAESAVTLMDTNPNMFSLALVRDPIERLQSAWKSKVACDNSCYRIDTDDRNWFVPQLLDLAGNTSKETCLSFPDFVDVLFSIHTQGKEGFLNLHFLPQNLHCFRDIPVEKWGKVATVKDADMAKELALHVGNTAVSSLPRIHVSDEVCSENLLSSETVRSRLDAITKVEYTTLGMAPPA